MTQQDPKPQRQAKSSPACLSPAILEWALTLPGDECDKVLSLPCIPGHTSKAMVPVKPRG